MSIQSALLKVIKDLRSLDPVKHCNVYKTVGCAHVDGMLCNVKSCDIQVVIKVTPRNAVEVDK